MCIELSGVILDDFLLSFVELFFDGVEFVLYSSEKIKVVLFVIKEVYCLGGVLFK